MLLLFFCLGVFACFVSRNKSWKIKLLSFFVICVLPAISIGIYSILKFSEAEVYRHGNAIAEYVVNYEYFSKVKPKDVNGLILSKGISSDDSIDGNIHKYSYYEVVGKDIFFNGYLYKIDYPNKVISIVNKSGEEFGKVNFKTREEYAIDMGRNIIKSINKYKSDSKEKVEYITAKHLYDGISSENSKDGKEHKYVDLVLKDNVLVASSGMKYFISNNKIIIITPENQKINLDLESGEVL